VGVVNRAWDKPLKLHEVRGPATFDLAPDAGQRAGIAADLGLESLPALSARLTVRPWLDGVEIEGAFEAIVEQVCGVTLDPFEQPVSGEIFAQAVPAGSPHAPPPEGRDLELDLEASDPPDVLAGDAVDLAGYVTEHLALSLDPFPRKPDATFDYEPPKDETSPFAALKKLQDPKA
jgi:hypothetical protein